MEYGSCYLSGHDIVHCTMDANIAEHEAIKMAWKHIYEYLSSSFTCHIYGYMSFGGYAANDIFQCINDVCGNCAVNDCNCTALLLLCGEKISLADRQNIGKTPIDWIFLSWNDYLKV